MPMREVTMKEAVFLCRFQGIRTMKAPPTVNMGSNSAFLDYLASKQSVNALAESFIGGLQVLNRVKEQCRSYNYQLLQ
jgi:hypothetical protein